MGTGIPPPPRVLNFVFLSQSLLMYLCHSNLVSLDRKYFCKRRLQNFFLFLWPNYKTTISLFLISSLLYFQSSKDIIMTSSYIHNKFYTIIFDSFRYFRVSDNIQNKRLSYFWVLIHLLPHHIKNIAIIHFHGNLIALLLKNACISAAYFATVKFSNRKNILLLDFVCNKEVFLL